MPATPPRPLQMDVDTTHFDCGNESINRWLQRHAWNNHEDGISRASVICDSANGALIGFVTLSSAQIERAFLPKSQQRNRPDPMPVTLLGRLAISISHQGQGHAWSLLRYALQMALHASRDVGSFGVITHPINDTVRAFYARWDFEDLPFDPHRTMLVRMAELRRSGLGD